MIAIICLVISYFRYLQRTPCLKRSTRRVLHLHSKSDDQLTACSSHLDNFTFIYSIIVYNILDSKYGLKNAGPCSEQELTGKRPA